MSRTPRKQIPRAGWAGGMPSLEDAELVAESRAGNQFAFELLVRKYRQRVGGLIADLVESHDDVEDLVQETFVWCYNNLRRCPPTGFQWYLFRVAMNRVHNHQRSLLRRVRRFFSSEEAESLGDEEFGTVAGSSDHSLARDALGRVRRKEMFRALRGLPDKQRVVMMMRHREELSFSEIAALMQMPLGTVHTLYTRGLERLRKTILPLFDEERS